jgi:uncharacterized phage protein (TIGR02218 family)
VKSIPAALQAHYDTGGTCLAYGLVVQRSDGAVYGFTSHDKPLSLDVSAWGISPTPMTFSATQGLVVSDVVTTIGFEVDNLELTTLDDGTLFDRDEVLAGTWTEARFRLFKYRWDVSPVTIANHTETVMRGWFGNVTLNQNTIAIELRGLAQKLQQPVGIVSTKTCRARLGDSACTVDLAPFTHNLTVTSVVDQNTFTASAATQAAAYFDEGIVTWLTGDNAASRSQRVRSFAAGQFTLQLPTVLPIQIGDTFQAIAGCRKRLTEDCRDKFDNVLNFQGEPHRPTTDDILKPPA